MKITIWVIITCCLFSLSSVAQNTHSIKGATVDTIAKTKLTTTVTVMNAKDSIVMKFIHAADDGTFAIDGLPAGNFLLLVTYPDYADYVEGFSIDQAQKVHDFGKIKMDLKSRILQEVIIKGSVSLVKIKGDTTEFNAKNFVIQPNSKVEDLLKQVPGMEVDQDGKITFQGEKINKVLVDGEEFFGDDPKLVTRNIRGDMVDKLQIYDKKSDQAAFTGIEDGVRIKTLNVTLKEDKKNGIFGKINAGYGTDKYNEGQLLYNRFRAKSKFSLYATTANDGKQGLGIDDNAKLGTTGSNIQISDGGSISGISFNSNDVDNGYGQFFGSGLPLSRTGGVHYDTKWNNNKESINTNFKLGSLAVNSDQTTKSQNILDPNSPSPATTTNTESATKSYNNTTQQKLDMVYQQTLSTSSTIKVDVNGTNRDKESRTNSTYSQADGNNNLVTSTNSTNNSKGQQQLFNADVFYAKRFKKLGRNFSWDVNGTYSKDNTNKYADERRYIGITKTDTLTDQFTLNNLVNTTFNSNMTYTEPISSKLALTMNYGLGLINQTNDVEVYNQSVPGSRNYDAFDPLFSNDYKYNVLTNQAGANFNYRFGNSVLTFGTKVSIVDTKQVNEFTDSVRNRNYIKWLPQLNYTYRKNNAQTFSLRYTGSTQQPTLDQIQPLRSNTSTVNIRIGNPNLQPAFRHNMNLSYSVNKGQNNIYYSIQGSYSFTVNSIIPSQNINTTTGRTITQYINLQNKMPGNYYVFANGSKKLQGPDMTVNLSLNVSGNTYYTDNIIDGKEVFVNSSSTSYGTGISLSKNKVNKYNFRIGFNPNYRISQPDNYKIFGYSLNGSTTLYLPGKFIFTSNISDSYTGKANNSPAFSRVMWNADLGRTFLKEKNLKLSITGNNLLNQNNNYRSSSGTGVSEYTYSSIMRYFMATVTWDFTKFGTVKN